MKSSIGGSFGAENSVIRVVLEEFFSPENGHYDSDLCGFEILRDFSHLVYLSNDRDSKYRWGLEVGHPVESMIRQAVADLFVMLYTSRNVEFLVGNDPNLIGKFSPAKWFSELQESEFYKQAKPDCVHNVVNTFITVVAMIETLADIGTIENIDKSDIDKNALNPDNKQLKKIKQMIKQVDESEELIETDDTETLDVGGGASEEGDDEIQAVTPTEAKLRVAMMAKNNSNLQDVFKAIGKMEMIKNKMLDDAVDSVEHNSTIDSTDAIDEADLSYLITRSPEMIASDMAEGALEMISGEEEGGMGNGPVIAVVDKSGSMSMSMDVDGDMLTRMDLSVGIAYQLAKQCSQNNRPFALITFASHSSVHVTTNEHGKMDVKNLKNLLQVRSGGGTSFKSMLRTLGTLLDQHSVFSYEKADVVIITDGEASRNEQDMSMVDMCQKVKAKWDEQGLKAFVMNIGPSSWPLKFLSDYPIGDSFDEYIEREYKKDNSFKQEMKEASARVKELQEMGTLTKESSHRFSENIQDDLKKSCESLFGSMIERQRGTDWL